MRALRGRVGRLGGVGLMAAGVATTTTILGGSGSVPVAVLLAASSWLLATALAVSGRTPVLAAVTALTGLGAVILAVTAAKAVTGSSPGALSAVGAFVAFLVAPAVSAYGLREWRGFRAAVVASAAVPLIFIASVVLDGPILQGAGATIDAIDAVIVPLWLVILAANLLVAG